MRKMKLDYWKAMDQEGKEMQESLIEVFSALLRNQNPQNMPKGLDKFRIKAPTVNPPANAPTPDSSIPQTYL